VPQLSPATGFWSYAHVDDDAMAGHVLELAEQVAKVFQMISTDTISIFVDRKALQWGEEWRSKISDTILGNTFFIPIISPNYLKSPTCRSEFMEFWAGVSLTSELKKLLLPIYYEDAGIHESDDEICKIVTALQYEDWRKQKFEDKRSPDYRKLLHKMGNRLVDIAQEVAGTPETEPEAGPEAEPGPKPGPTPKGPSGAADVSKETSPAKVGSEDEGEGPDSGGLFDAWARAEELVSTFTEQFATVQRAVESLVSEIGREPPPKNASAGQRLFYINAISSHIQRPAEEFEAGARELERTTRELTAAVMAVVEYLADPLWAEAMSKQEIDIDTLRAQGDQLAAQLEQLKTVRALVVSIGRMSRTMREPVALADRGFDYIEATGEAIASWLTAFESLAIESQPNSPAGQTN
jgi:TIR domain